VKSIWSNGEIEHENSMSRAGTLQQKGETV
jgi:hypothetical protein